jgi:hypothetical protein
MIEKNEQQNPNVRETADYLLREMTDVGRQVREQAVFVDELRLMDGTSGGRLVAVPLTERYRRRFGNPYAVVHRTDLHQPLHNEDVALGGNRIYVTWEGHNYNLHHVWDTEIAEKWLGNSRGSPYQKAFKWANQLVVEITDGKFAEEKDGWLKDLDFSDSVATAMAWSRECNALVCSHGWSFFFSLVSHFRLQGHRYRQVLFARSTD